MPRNPSATGWRAGPRRVAFRGEADRGGVFRRAEAGRARWFLDGRPGWDPVDSWAGGDPALVSGWSVNTCPCVPHTHNLLPIAAGATRAGAGR
jgi:hypothetical protein